MNKPTKMIRWMLLVPACLLIACSAPSGSDSKGFEFREFPEGVALSEDGASVFFYQKVSRSPNGISFFSNYLHPLYSLDGDTLTEEFPEDHLHHRGIFWAWHQVFQNDSSLGDGWMMEGIMQEVDHVELHTNSQEAILNTRVFWSSALLGEGERFLEENTRIITHPLMGGIRIIDFEISLKALLPGIRIGGSNDEKGYGGFSIRIKMPEDLLFSSDKGPVKPEELQIEAGSWLDFSGSYGREREVSGVTLLCHPETPNYPAPWILRQERSMQNIVFPGRNLLDIPMENALVLKYRMVIHPGDVHQVDMRLVNPAN